MVHARVVLDAHNPTRLIVPLTTNLVDRAEPLRLRVSATDHLRRESDLLIDQLRAIYKRRHMQCPMNTLLPALMTRVHEALAEVLDLDQNRS
jgi:mRNA interferase MazF